MKSPLACVREMEERNQRFAAVKKKTEVGFSFPLHWHRYFECEIVLGGAGEHTCNGSSYTASRGDFWLMSSYDFHTYEPTEETELMHVCFELGFLPRELEELVSVGGIFGKLDPESMQEVETVCEALLREETTQDGLSELSRRALVDRLIVVLLRHTEIETAAHTSGIGGALAYVHKHFREALSLEHVAQMQGFSVNYFGTLFKSAVGVSFRDYLNKIRLRYACDLLLSSKLTVKEIAFESGYTSIEYFVSVFKKKLLVTPAEYRRLASVT